MFKDEKLEEFKNVKYDDLEDLVYRLQITCDEIIVKIDPKKYSHEKNRLIFRT